MQPLATPMPLSPVVPTFISNLGDDDVTQQLRDFQPLVQREVADALQLDKGRLNTGLGELCTQLESSDALAQTTDWVPSSWQAAALGPQSVQGWCAPWLFSQRSGSTRMSSDVLPTNGFATLYTVVEGQGCFFLMAHRF